MPIKHPILIISLLIFASQAHSQSVIDRITELFEFELHRRHHDSTHYATHLVVAPIVSYEPSTSLGVGAGFKFLFKPQKAGEETRTSNIPVSLIYTLRNQFVVTAGYEIFFPEEKWLLKGRSQYSKFPIQYYGLGRDSRLDQEQEVSYNRALIEPLLFKRIKGSFFLGGGIRYRKSFNADLEDYQSTAQNEQLIDSLESTSLGLALAMTLDSRDNILNASEGDFLEFTHGVYHDQLGSTTTFSLSKIDYRKYTTLRSSTKHVLAFQAYGRIAWGNGAPLAELSTLGGAELLRGFQEERFRDPIAYFTQVEYRWQAFRRIGFVLYSGAGDVMNRQQKISASSLKYSVGTGIRFKIVAQENLNIRLDYALGFGRERVDNFYLGLAEAF